LDALLELRLDGGAVGGARGLGSWSCDGGGEKAEEGEGLHFGVCVKREW